MSGNLYNIDDYTINDIVTILDLEYPILKKTIFDVIDKNVESTTNDQVKTFYENMKKKVQQYLFENGIDTITEDGYGLNKLFLFKEGYEDGTVGDRAQQNVTITDPIRSVMTRKYLNDPGEIQQGVNNPVLRQTTQKILSIDSHYRDNLLFRPTTTFSTDTSGNCQTTVNDNEVIPPSSSTDYIIEFPEPISNVLSFYVKSFEIPTSWYVFTEKDGTSYFDISCNGLRETIQIPDGNYKYDGAIDVSNTLQVKLQDAIDDKFGGTSSVSFNENTFKMTISDVSGGNDFSMFFYTNETNYNNSSCVNLQTKDHNLGWLLGFRKTTYTGSTSYTSESCIDIFGPKTIYIEFDDFNSNYDGQVHVSNTNLSNKKIDKLPSYYNRNYCNSDGTPTVNGNSVSINGGNIDNSTTPQRLTKAQVFTVEQILEQQLRSKTERLQHTLPNNIISRISVPVTRNSDAVGNLIWLDTNESDVTEYTRSYFGPATIKRAHIRLLNDRGNVIDLNHMDWSFALSVTQLYQY